MSLPSSISSFWKRKISQGTYNVRKENHLKSIERLYDEYLTDKESLNTEVYEMNLRKRYYSKSIFSYGSSFCVYGQLDDIYDKSEFLKPLKRRENANNRIELKPRDMNTGETVYELYDENSESIFNHKLVNGYNSNEDEFAYRAVVTAKPVILGEKNMKYNGIFTERAFQHQSQKKLRNLKSSRNDSAFYDDVSHTSANTIDHFSDVKIFQDATDASNESVEDSMSKQLQSNITARPKRSPDGSLDSVFTNERLSSSSIFYQEKSDFSESKLSDNIHIRCISNADSAIGSEADDTDMTAFLLICERKNSDLGKEIVVEENINEKVENLVESEINFENLLELYSANASNQSFDQVEESKDQNTDHNDLCQCTKEKEMELCQTNLSNESHISPTNLVSENEKDIILSDLTNKVADGNVKPNLHFNHRLYFTPRKVPRRPNKISTPSKFNVVFNDANQPNSHCRDKLSRKNSPVLHQNLTVEFENAENKEIGCNELEVPEFICDRNCLDGDGSESLAVASPRLSDSVSLQPLSTDEILNVSNSKKLMLPPGLCDDSTQTDEAIKPIEPIFENISRELKTDFELPASQNFKFRTHDFRDVFHLMNVVSERKINLKMPPKEDNVMRNNYKVTPREDLLKSNTISEYLFLLQVNSKYKLKRNTKLPVRCRSFFYKNYMDCGSFYKALVVTSSHIVYTNWLTILFPKPNKVSSGLQIKQCSKRSWINRGRKSPEKDKGMVVKYYMYED